MREKLQLRCGALEESIVFTIEIARDATVEKLKEAIVAAKADACECFRVASRGLTMYLARDADGQWLQADSKIWHMLKEGAHAYRELAWRESICPGVLEADWEPALHDVHVLVKCPPLQQQRKRCSEQRSHRQSRWEDIEEVLATFKTRAISDQTWHQVAPVFDADASRCAVVPLAIPATDLAALLTTISWMLRSFDFTLIDTNDCGHVYRLHVVSQIVWAVAQLLPDVKVHVEQTVVGERVEADGHFAIVLERGRKRIGIYQVRDEAFALGATRALLGCEVLADVHNTSEVYAVVTDAEKWQFFQSFDTKILRDASTVLTLDSTSESKAEALQKVTGKLFSLLTN